MYEEDEGADTVGFPSERFYLVGPFNMLCDKLSMRPPYVEDVGIAGCCEQVYRRIAGQQPRRDRVAQGALTEKLQFHRWRHCSADERLACTLFSERWARRPVYLYVFVICKVVIYEKLGTSDLEESK